VTRLFRNTALWVTLTILTSIPMLSSATLAQPGNKPSDPSPEAEKAAATKTEPAPVPVGDLKKPKDEGRGPLPLKVFSLPDVKKTDAVTLGNLKVVEKFREHFLKKYGYPIGLQRFSGIEIQGMGMDSRPLLAIAGDMAPDILYVNFRQSQTYIGEGFIKPLDKWISKISQEDMDYRIPKPVFPVIYRRKEKNEEKHYWAVPYGALVRVLMYRKDLFDEVGLEGPPKDWNELEEYSRLLTRPEEGTYGLLFAKGEHAAWDWITFLWSAGGKAVELNEDGDWICKFDSDEAVTAMLYYVRLNAGKWKDASGTERRGFVCTETTQRANELWEEGKIGMRITYLNAQTLGGRSGINPDTTGFAPVPLGPTGLRGSELNCTMMGMFSDIKGRGGYTKEEIEQAAWEYIWFYDSREAREIRTQVMVEQGMGQFVNPMYLKEFGYDEYLEMVPKTWLPTFEEAMKNGQPEPYGKNCQMVYNYMTFPLSKLIQMEKDGELSDIYEERRSTVKDVLEKAVVRGNEEMIGILPDDERAYRNSVAFVVGICLFTVFLIILWRVWIIFTPKEVVEKGGWQFYRYRWAYIIMLPAVISILLWKYYPMGTGMVMAFKDYNILGSSDWTGFKNLADVLWDETWWKSLGRTLYYMALMMGIGFPAPIILAILLAEVPKGKMFYRTIFYLPAVLSGMVVLYLWKLMYDKSPAGILNSIIGMVGIPPQEWLDNPSMAMVCCVIPTVWAGMGPGCLIYLAALKAVPDDLYEAADIDGCGFVAKIWHITIPTLKGLVIIQFIGQFIMSAQSTRFILVMTFGGPNEATQVAGLHIFKKAYLLLQFGPAITMSWMLGVVMLCFTTFQLKRLSRMEFTTAETRKAKANQG
jgi:ABC-type sugar transport system permease subunit/ABC-type glycerol-3-phosphate transport system substrate-binding protein